MQNETIASLTFIPNRIEMLLFPEDKDIILHLA